MGEQSPDARADTMGLNLDETPITADVLLGAIALEVRAIQAGATDRDDRLRRIATYCDALATDGNRWS